MRRGQLEMVRDILNATITYHRPTQVMQAANIASDRWKKLINYCISKEFLASTGVTSEQRRWLIITPLGRETLTYLSNLIDTPAKTEADF